MIYAVTKNNKKLYNFGSKSDADKYAKQVGGTVVQLKNNPELEKFGKQEDTYEARLYRLDQYRTSPSVAWWREAIQNAVDVRSNATEVICREYYIQGGKNANKIIVECDDNGLGMSKNELKELFLKYGGTGKGQRDKGESLGGFGEAKKLLLLAWRSWYVLTNNGNETTVADCPKGGDDEYFIDSKKSTGGNTGTSIQIMTWSATGNQKHVVRASSAIAIIAKCDLPKVKFKIERYSMPECDGFSWEEVADARIKSRLMSTETPNANFSLGRRKEQWFRDSEGNVYASDEWRRLGKTGKLLATSYFKNNPKNSYLPTVCYFRVKGLYLWEIGLHADVKGQAIIEFETKTTEILSDNRDGIRDANLRIAVESWLSSLQKDPSNTLRKYGEKQTKISLGFGSLTAPQREAHRNATRRMVNIASSMPEIAKPDVISDEIVKQLQRAASLEQENVLNPITVLPENIIKGFIKLDTERSNDSEKKSENRSAIINSVKRLMHIPDYCTRIEDDYIDIEFKIPAKFIAESMGDDVKRLLAVWSEACRIVMMLKGAYSEYGVGFIFGEKIKGAAATLSDPESGVYELRPFLLLNPFKEDGKLKNIKDIEELKDIWSTAIHEVTHLADHMMGHNDAFWDMVQINFAICCNAFPLFAEISRIAAISDKIERSEFAKNVDLDEFESAMRLGRGPKSRREKVMEKKVVEAICESVRMGNKAPNLDDEFGRMLSQESKSAIANASRSSTLSSEMSDYDRDLQKKQVESLKKQLEIARKEAVEAKKKSEEPQKQTTITPKFKLIPFQDLLTRYKNN